MNKGVNIPPREQSSPLGARFTPRVKLRMALWYLSFHILSEKGEKVLMPKLGCKFYGGNESVGRR
jgi:hypothetical protein